MTDLFLNNSFEKLGWASVQFLWISTVYLSGIVLIWKVLKPFSPKLKYNLGLGAILSLFFIPILLFVEHQGILSPLGLADWSSTNTAISQEPIIQGLPRISGIDIAAIIPSFYYWLGIFGTLMAAIFLGYYLYSVIGIYLNLQQKPTLNNHSITDNLNELANDLRIAKNFKVKKCSNSEGPAVMGIFHPFILLPPSLSDYYDNQELRGLLLHELIHIKRNDYLFSLIQHLANCLFFFQPLVWFLNKRINQKRELVCDQAVTQITQDTHTYGNTLVKLQIHSQSALSYSLNMADHDLVHRLQQLKDNTKRKPSIGQQFKRLSFALLVIAIILCSTLWNSYHLHYSHNKHFQSTDVHKELNKRDLNEKGTSKPLIREVESTLGSKEGSYTGERK